MDHSTLITLLGLPAVAAPALVFGILAVASLLDRKLNEAAIGQLCQGAILIGLASTLSVTAVMTTMHHYHESVEIGEWVAIPHYHFSIKLSFDRLSLPFAILTFVLCGTVIFLVSMFFAPERGIVAQLAQVWTLRRKVGRENLLRTLYELSEDRLPQTPVVPLSELVSARAWTHFDVSLVLRRLRREGLLEMIGGGARLTAPGLEQAIAVTRAHRLWELYLIEGAHIAPDHVDRDADVLEHVLPGELVERLESRLATDGNVPIHAGDVPPSPA